MTHFGVQGYRRGDQNFDIFYFHHFDNEIKLVYVGL